MRRRRTGDEGAVAVEAALVTPLIVLLLFGTIEFGLALKDWLNVTSAVRSGARIASAEPRLSSYADDTMTQVKNALVANNPPVATLIVYKADADGNALGAASVAACTVCVKYTWDQAGKTFATPAAGSWPATSHNACFGEQDRVGVYLEITHPTVTKLFMESLSIADKSVMSFEPQPGTCKP
jgi:Flp pilus assembly protein TadG